MFRQPRVAACARNCAIGAFAATATFTRCVMCGAAPSSESMIEVHDGQARPSGTPSAGRNMKL